MSGPLSIEAQRTAGTPAASADRRILVAGIGNVFMADDGFGVELAQRLLEAPLPDGVEVKEFGIRSMDLAFALGEGWDAVVMLDATPRGGEPGSVYVIEAGEEEGALSLDTHGMDPVQVLGLAKRLGPLPERILVVGCEPLVRMDGSEDEVVAELSGRVREAIEPAAQAALSLVEELLSANGKEARA